MSPSRRTVTLTPLALALLACSASPSAPPDGTKGSGAGGGGGSAAGGGGGSSAAGGAGGNAAGGSAAGGSAAGGNAAGGSAAGGSAAGGAGQAGKGGVGGGAAGGANAGAAGAAYDCRGEAIPEGTLPLDPGGSSATVACGTLSLRLGVVSAGVVRLTYLGSTPPPTRPSYAVVGALDEPGEVVFGQSAARAMVCTGELYAEIDRASCRVRVLDKAGQTLLEDGPSGGYYEEGAARGVRRSAPAGERYYGFGERTGKLDRRGTRMVFWNTDAYVDAFGGYPPDADPLYQSIPFFVALRAGRAHGVFTDNTHRLTFDMAKQDAAAYDLRADGGVVDQYVITGPRMADVLRRYTALTGRAPLPPRWALGYHQSRWGYSPAQKLIDVADELRSRGIGADALWLDIQHMNGFRSFTWDPSTFADPKSLMAALAQRHFHAVAIVDPAIKVDPAWDVYKTGIEKNLFLGKQGKVHVGEVWPGPSVFPDFTLPAARAFWASLVPRTTGPGVDGLWIDMNEPSDFSGGPGGSVPDDLEAAGDGQPTTMAEIHNVYALAEAQATREGMAQASPGKRPFLLTRAGYAGIQRYAAVWTGDAPSTFATLRTTLPMLLGMGLSGVPFVGSDVGGYSGGATPELFARWVQLGMLSPFFRAHVQTKAPAQEPWQFGIEVTDISREAIAQRYEFLPYFYSLFRASTLDGSPLLRPLVYEFEGDEVAASIDDQAMLGPHLLAAPVLDEGATSRKVYLPGGRWYEARSGAAYDGPATIDVGLTQAALPMFARQGAIVFRGPPVHHDGEAPLSPLFLDLYPSPTETSATLYEDEGASTAYQQGQYSSVEYRLRQTASGATLTAGPREGSYAPPARPLVARVRLVAGAVSGVKAGGAPLEARSSHEALLAAGSGYYVDARDRSLVVMAKDAPGQSIEMSYDTAVTDLAPPVTMRLRVKVPPGTPKGTPIHIATSASGWAHQPMTWGPEPDVATAEVVVPRGQWFFYKYTRGGWDTVEKWPGCVEATNRYAFGAANPVKEDTVFAWADGCQAP